MFMRLYYLLAAAAWVNFPAAPAVLAAGAGPSEPIALRLPRLPDFGGDLAPLFGTNRGFSAQMTLETRPTGSKNARVVKGLLLFRDGSTLFEVASDSASRSGRQAKRAARAGLTVITAPALGKRWIVSEAVSGYSEGPWPAPQSRTNVLHFEPAETSTERLQGHPCRLAKATSVDDSGEPVRYRVWQATDLDGLPLRLEQHGDGRQTTTLLTDVRLEKPPAQLFRPPEGYTRYDSLEAMVTEMMRRQSLQSRPRRSAMPDLDNYQPPRP